MNKKRKQKITWKDLTKSEKIIVILIRASEFLIAEASIAYFAMLTIEKLLK